MSFDPTTGANANSPFAHAMPFPPRGPVVTAATTIAGGTFSSAMYYYTTWQAYRTASELAYAVQVEAQMVIDAVGDEIASFVHQVGYLSRAAALALVLGILFWGLRPVIKKFTWVWPSPFAQAAPAGAGAGARLASAVRWSGCIQYPLPSTALTMSYGGSHSIMRRRHPASPPPSMASADKSVSV